MTFNPTQLDFLLNTQINFRNTYYRSDIDSLLQFSLITEAQSEELRSKAHSSLTIDQLFHSLMSLTAFDDPSLVSDESIEDPNYFKLKTLRHFLKYSCIKVEILDHLSKEYNNTHLLTVIAKPYYFSQCQYCLLAITAEAVYS